MSQKPSILFVDDEEAVLGGLRSSLYRERKRWEFRFAISAGDALDLLDERPADVVVSDMRMPKMDGAEFLEQLRELHPGTLRLVLTGQADEDMALRAMPVAHQWLTKPCERETMVTALERALEARQLLADPTLAEIVGELSSLPTVPKIYQRLTRAIQNPDTCMSEVGDLVEQDVSMSARVLQISNSPLLGLQRPVRDVRDAVGVLGLQTLAQLVLTSAAFQEFSEASSAEGFSIGALQRNVQLGARLARAVLPPDDEQVQELVTALLLHKVGMLVLAVRRPQAFSAALREARDSGRRLAEIEHDLFGTTHARVGAALLAVWGLPLTMVEAILQHTAVTAPDPLCDLVIGTHVASVLADEALAQEPDALPISASLDPRIAEQLGDEAISNWRELAENYVVATSPAGV